MAPDKPTRTPDVLTSLPRTRPQRRSAKRGAPSASSKTAATPKRPTDARKPAGKPGVAAQAKSRGATAPRKRTASAPRKAPRASAGRRAIPPAGYAPPQSADGRRPSGTELVSTAIQAAGELAQIGMAVGGQALKSALGRLGGS